MCRLPLVDLFVTTWCLQVRRFSRILHGDDCMGEFDLWGKDLRSENVTWQYLFALTLILHWFDKVELFLEITRD